MAHRRHQTKRRETVAGFVPTSNPEQARWMHQLASSSAASKHTPAPRKGTRSAHKRAAIREQRYI